MSLASIYIADNGVYCEVCVYISSLFIELRVQQFRASNVGIENICALGVY